MDELQGRLKRLTSLILEQEESTERLKTERRAIEAEIQRVEIAGKPARMSRVDQLAIVRAQVRAAFPTARVTTNDDANVATPLSVLVDWGGNQRHAVRADALDQPLDEYIAKAIADCKKWIEIRTGGVLAPVE